MQKFYTISGLFLTSLICLSVIYLGYNFSVNYFYFNVDVAWHLQVAKLILEGKNLYSQIIEVNFPFIYYSKLITILIAEKFKLNLLFVTNIFHFILCFANFLLCIFVIVKTEGFNLTEKLSLTVAACFCLFLIPFTSLANQVGQKEHYFIIFFLPYFLSNFIPKKSKPVAILIGISTCLAIITKPFFILFFIVNEIIKMGVTKNIKSFNRLDFYVCIAGLFLFAIIFLLFFRDYFYNIATIIKYTYGTHFDFIYKKFLQLLAREATAIMLILCMLILRPEYKKLIYFLGFYLCGFYISLIQNHSLDTVRIPLYCAELLLTFYSAAYSLKFVSNKENLNDIKSALIIMLSVCNLFMGYIVAIKSNYTNDATNVKPQYSFVENLLKKAPTEKVLVLSKALNYSFPAIFLADKQSGFLYSSTWVIEVIGRQYKEDKITKSDFIKSQYLVKNMLLEIKSNIQNYKPSAIVFVDFKFIKNIKKEKTSFHKYFNESKLTKNLLKNFTLKETQPAKMGKLYLYIRNSQSQVD